MSSPFSLEPGTVCPAALDASFSSQDGEGLDDEGEELCDVVVQIEVTDLRGLLRSSGCPSAEAAMCDDGRTIVQFHIEEKTLISNSSFFNQMFNHLEGTLTRDSGGRRTAPALEMTHAQLEAFAAIVRHLRGAKQSPGSLSTAARCFNVLSVCHQWMEKCTPHFVKLISNLLADGKLADGMIAHPGDILKVTGLMNTCREALIKAVTPFDDFVADWPGLSFEGLRFVLSHEDVQMSCDTLPLRAVLQWVDDNCDEFKNIDPKTCEPIMQTLLTGDVNAEAKYDTANKSAWAHLARLRALLRLAPVSDRRFLLSLDRRFNLLRLTSGGSASTRDWIQLFYSGSDDKLCESTRGWTKLQVSIACLASFVHSWTFSTARTRLPVILPREKTFTMQPAATQAAKKKVSPFSPFADSEFVSLEQISLSGMMYHMHVRHGLSSGTLKLQLQRAVDEKALSGTEHDVIMSVKLGPGASHCVNGKGVVLCASKDYLCSFPSALYPRPVVQVQGIDTSAPSHAQSFKLSAEFLVLGSAAAATFFHTHNLKMSTRDVLLFRSLRERQMGNSSERRATCNDIKEAKALGEEMQKIDNLAPESRYQELTNCTPIDNGAYAADIRWRAHDLNELIGDRTRAAQEQGQPFASVKLPDTSADCRYTGVKSGLCRDLNSAMEQINRSTLGVLQSVKDDDARESVAWELSKRT
jgi:hypothetical protein